MANKCLCALFSAALLLCACAHKQAESTAQKVISTPLIEEHEPTENSQKIISAPAKQKKNTLSAEKLPQQPPTPQTEKAPEITPENRVEQARKAQMLSAPTPDKISFEDEELISLAGRRLSPLAYNAV